MFLNEATKLRAQTIIKGLEKRNMHGVFCATKEDALKQALSYIKEGSSVSWGGSMSVSEIGLMDALKEGNYHLIDRSVAKNFDEQREIFSKAVLDGIKRVRNFASPPNTLRLGLKTPCSMTGRCGDCYGDTCICSQIVVTRRQSAMMKDRVKVILVGESLGY